MLGPDDYVPATGDDRNQESNQGSFGDSSQVQAGADIEKLHAQTSSPAVRRSDISGDMVRIRNMGTHQKTRKNDTIDKTNNAPTHHTNILKMQKDRETKGKTVEDKDTNDSRCTGGESEDGQSSIFHRDQDSDVSFESDNDEEIDASEFEEEDWVDYINRSTNEAIENMGNEKMRCWNKTHKKCAGDWH